jgi:xylulose-5-phosphate/fructose-6-phosphate phosphoketolase
MTDVDVGQLDRWWRAANYLTVGQIYLLGNPLLGEPLRAEHVKPRLLGHWGTSPGLNLLYAHLNRVIRDGDLEALFVCGPGHGGPALVANTWLEGTYTERYPSITRDARGMAKLFRQFSFPGGIPSHASPDTPGSIHEGGELGYSLAHAYGAAFDNPDLLVACVIGDGEAETGPLAAAWHSNKFLDPARDGAVLPILHLNGYKIANPTVLARIDDGELDHLLRGYGHQPYLVETDDATEVHGLLADALDEIVAEVHAIQRRARHGGVRSRPRWPALVLRTPKGWTGPKVVDGLPVEGTWRSHQVPLADVRSHPDRLAQLDEWLRSYRPDELFGPDGTPADDLTALAPRAERRMGASRHANGGLVTRDLELPDLASLAVPVDRAGADAVEPTRVLGRYLRDVFAANAETANFRVVGPDETASNRLDAVYEVTDKAWQGDLADTDEHLATTGRVMEILSEHTCQGWLEGYVLTGRHGFFDTYEAFVHVVDSMFNQHAKWLEASRSIPWRQPVPSFNYLLSSHVWRQDHNGFSHQDPGFLDAVVNKQPEVVRVLLPPDANCLLAVADECLRSRDRINVIVAGKQPGPTWLDLDAAVAHCERGLGLWDWASTHPDVVPDVVLACAGDIPTLETLAAVDILRTRLPELAVRVVNVVDLLRLQPDSEHARGLPDREYVELFTTDRPVVFAFHGYPWLVHRLAYRRPGATNLHVRGFKEQGTTTTPFDMLMLNDLDRFHLVMDVIDRTAGLGVRAAALRQEMVDRRREAREWTRTHGEDMPEIRDWAWARP